MRLLTTGLAFFSVCTTFASVTFTPHPGFSTAPNYFSGTNCRAHYSAQITFPSNYITSATLKINSSIVWQGSYPPPSGKSQPGRVRVDPVIMWDSSHFTSGTSVSVQLTVVTNAGNFTNSYTSIVKNSVGAYTISGFPNGSSVVSTQMTPAQYLVSAVFGGGWDDIAYLNDMQNHNVMFAGTHGYPTGNFQTDTPSPADSHLVNWAEVESSRITQIGSGLPPYNSTGKPQINLAFLQTCNVGDVNDQVRHCYPYYNAYGGYLEDQAFFAYNVYTKVSDIDDIPEEAFGLLASAYTLHYTRAVLAANSDYECADVTGSPTIWRDLTEADITVYGDPYLRLKTVYQPSHAIGTTWFSIISS